MNLVLILALLYASAAEELPEEEEEVQPQHCNCTQLLQSEDATTDISPTFPATSFTCWGRYDGYYADIEVDCTIFHYCQTWHYPTGLNETVKWDFACPQSTIFNQKVLSCTPPNISFDCQESPNYYWVNYNLTSSTTTPAPPTEFSTPIPNFGQQLIVGGIGAQSATFPDSSEPATDSYFVESTTFRDSAAFPDLPPASVDLEQAVTFPNSDQSVAKPPQPVIFPDATHPDSEQSASFSDSSRIPKESAQPATFSEFFHNQHPHQPTVTANSPDSNFAESGSGSDPMPEVVNAGNDSEIINFPI